MEYVPAYKLSVWMAENGKDVLWLTYSFLAENDYFAMVIATDYMKIRRCTNEIVRLEVKKTR